MDPSELMRPCWRGQRGRLEVWYTTLTDPATGTGLWLHHELVAPTDGSPAYAHGWAGVFPVDRPPVLARFGPVPWQRPAGDTVFDAAGVSMTPSRLAGAAGEVSWELAGAGGGPPLYTFPRWAWRRQLLPAAAIVPVPAATFTGQLGFDGTKLNLVDAPGASARIYGHGNARRWGWLHAHLGGGDLVEVVAAVSMRPGLRRLRPLPFVRLRLGGVDWPGGDPLLSALSFHARLDLPRWSVVGGSGDLRVRIEVRLPPERTLAVDYRDPDGALAVCHNSERADAVVALDRLEGGAWSAERRWDLSGTAHAELGLRH